MSAALAAAVQAVMNQRISAVNCRIRHARMMTVALRTKVRRHDQEAVILRDITRELDRLEALLQEG